MIGTSRRGPARIGLAAATAASAVVLAFGAAPANAVLPDFPHGHVYNGASPRCLDSGTSNGALLFTCSTSVYQQWVYNRLGEIVGNSPTGCLDDGAGVDGSRVVLVPCTGAASQRWSIQADGGPFVNQASGRCLDADLGTIGGQGTIVQVWDCSGAANQTWSFEIVP